MTCNLRSCRGKSLTLLREWLSPPQLSQYEKDKTFETIGSKTGKQYHIKQGNQQNVFDLDGAGRAAPKWRRNRCKVSEVKWRGMSRTGFSTASVASGTSCKR